jgi:hypothetical protein
MKWFVFLLAFWSASVLAQVQTGAEPGTKQGFSPRYFKTLPATWNPPLKFQKPKLISSSTPSNPSPPPINP